MKKEVVITARVTVEVKEVIQVLADKDDRTIAWMIRKLLIEALESRGIIKGQRLKKDVSRVR